MINKDEFHVFNTLGGRGGAIGLQLVLKDSRHAVVCRLGCQESSKVSFSRDKGYFFRIFGKHHYEIGIRLRVC